MTSSSTITMLHSRPSSSEAFQSPPQQSPRLGQAPRSMYNGSNNTAYKSSPSPVQPYAFQSTPHLKQESRTISAPSADQNLLSVQRAGHAQSASTSTASSSDASSAKDDSVIGTQADSSINFSSSVPDLTLNNFDHPAKPSPDRYRRTARRTNSNISPYNICKRAFATITYDRAYGKSRRCSGDKIRKRRVGETLPQTQSEHY
jgi:hypothetical protein